MTQEHHKLYSPQDIRIAAKTVYGEARGETFEGKLGVAWVIRNRAMNPGWWGGPELHTVCLQKWQFSCWNVGNPNRDRISALGDEDLLGANDAAQACLSAVLLAARGTLEDPTHGADYYVKSTWLDDPKRRPKWAYGQKPVAVLDSQSFFKLGHAG